MRAAGLLLLCALSSAPLAGAAADPPTQKQVAEKQAVARTLTLVLPHPLGPQEEAWVTISLGAIGHQRVVVTAAGQFVGLISPFAPRFGQDAGTYALPLPTAAVEGDHVTLTIAITEPGGRTRAPTDTEVRAVKLVIGE